MANLRKLPSPTFWGKHPLASSYYDFAVCLILYSLFMPALHEASHWLVAKAYGVDGVIQLGFPRSTFIPNSAPAGAGFYAMYFGGGILVFLAYALMYSRETQLEEKAGMGPVILQEVVYGVGEGYWALTGFSAATYNLILLMSNVAFAVGIIIDLVFLYRYWRTLAT